MNKVLTQIQVLLENEKYKDCSLKTDINNVIAQNEKLNFKKIKDLNNFHFNIPSYQRGYRWQVQQVEDLLNDINDYANQQDEKKAGFYCLQPVVVMEGGKIDDDKITWDVIDGQQRLTTIFMILKYFKKYSTLSIDYKTKKSSTSFLINIDDTLGDISVKEKWDDFPNNEKIKEKELWTCFINQEWKLFVEKNKNIDNIDNYHFFQAYLTIVIWFEYRNDQKTKWEKALLEKTQIIWYQVENKENGETLKSSIDAFMRLNSGKIPLTNSEMIRALFLINCVAEKDSTEIKLAKQQKLAVEWDNLERELQNEDFWGFITLNNPFKKDYPNRIEYIFDLIEDGTAKDHQDKYSTYRMYEGLIKSKSVEVLWLEVKQYYWRFHEWYINNELYHLIGYCWCIKRKSVKDLISSGSAKKESELVVELKQELNPNGIEKIEYGDGRIRNILLLFNIVTVIQNNKTLNAKKDGKKDGKKDDKGYYFNRFRFSNYLDESWDIEHVRSQTPENQEKWLKDVLDYYGKDSKIGKEIQAELDAKEINDYTKFIKKSRAEIEGKDDDENIEGKESFVNGIGNLVLLDSNTNRSYKNAIFPIKRREIIEREKNGLFVPACTKNIFLKLYSSDVSNMLFWTSKDADEYINEIKNKFDNYFANKENNNG
jgi:uncharacterized protein with ParB-like and HNH nuclease domain